MKRLITLLMLISFNAAWALSETEIREAYHKSFNYEKMQQYNEAIKAVMPVHQQYPEGYTVNLRLGWLYYLSQNYANALAHYEAAEKAAPYSLEPKLGRLLPLLAQEKLKEVEKEAFQILNTDYFNYYGNLRLVYALRLQKKNETAEKIALKMLSVYPIDVSFLTEYALIKHAQGDTSGAVKVFGDILILDPENVAAKAYMKS